MPLTSFLGNDPISLGIQDESLISILQRLRDIQAQPLIPQNPMAQMGTILQGFAAGTQGQANPALAQAMQQRQQNISQGYNAATLALSLRKEAMSEAKEKREEERRGRTDAEQIRQFEIGQASEYFRTGMSQGIGPLIQHGGNVLRKHGLLPVPEAQLENLVKDASVRAPFLKNFEYAAAQAMFNAKRGVIDPTLESVYPGLQQQAKANPEEFSAAFKIPDSATVIANRTRAKAEAERTTDKLEAERKIASGDLSPINFIIADKDFNQDKAVLYSYQLESTGTPLAKQPKVFQQARAAYELERDAKIMTGRINEIVLDLQKEVLAAKRRDASQDEFNVLLTRAKGLTPLMEVLSTDPKADLSTKIKVNSLIDDITSHMINSFKKEFKKVPKPTGDRVGQILPHPKQAPPPSAAPMRAPAPTQPPVPYIRPGSVLERGVRGMQRYRPELNVPTLGEEE